MQALFLVLHVLVGIGLITLILLQHGKGADAGAAFGSGASATVFGARGSATFLTKATAVLALLFFSNSFFLNYLFANTTGPKSIIEEQKEGNTPTEIIENTIAPIEEKESEPPQSDLPALPGESGRGVTGGDVPPAPVSPSPGSQGSDSPSPEAPAPESPAGDPRSAAPDIQAPAADTPKDAPAAGEGEAGATPKPVEGIESKSARPAESGPTAGPNAEPGAEPTPEAASPTEPPSAAAGKEPSAAAKPPATPPKVPAKKTQTATDKAATKRTPEPKTTKRQPSTGKSTSSTDKEKENKTP
ncbi:MAG: preprotein translocase subunit SecG [Gammaproteobacteria bacterium]|nr:preprotein translocase subunit SecG [Gammaproteobacteria bacterium]